jgi:pimeloyl-ACP methyl ester carboxylesterase
MEKQVNFLDGHLFYSVKGSGKAVVLLHGFLEDHSIWQRFSDKLSKKYTVISIDLPGFGKSSVFSTIHSMEFMAKAVKHILDVEKVEKCVLTGHSMGGYVSLAFAELYPETLNGLVLFHSQAAADSEEAKRNRDRTIELVKGDHSSFIHAFVPSLFAEKNVKPFAKEIGELRNISAKTPKEGIIAALAGMRDRNDALELISELHIPFYFIVGKQDSRIVLPVVMEQLCLPKNSEAIILDEVGHMGFIEAEEKTYLALESFIERTI